MKHPFLLLLLLCTSSSLMADRIKDQQKAPSLESTTAQGTSINLKQYEGKTVLLTFFRFAGCPVCNFRMHELMERYSELQAQNIEVIAVFESSNEVLSQYVEDYNIPFPLIGNPDRSLFKAYGVERSTRGLFRTLSNKEAKANMKKGKELFTAGTYKKDGSMKQMQADFLVNSEGLVTKTHYAAYIGDHIAISEVLAAGKSKDTALIETAIKNFVKAGDKQDVAALEKVLDANYRIVMNQLFGSDKVVVMNRDAYLAKIKAKEFGGDNRQITIESITMNGNNASALVTMAGSKMTFVSLLDLVKDASGNWMLVQDIPTIAK